MEPKKEIGPESTTPKFEAPLYRRLIDAAKDRYGQDEIGRKPEDLSVFNYCLFLAAREAFAENEGIQLEEIVGRGISSVVAKARVRGYLIGSTEEQDVAVKIALLPEGSKDYLEREAEYNAELYGRLEGLNLKLHENIVRCYSHGITRSELMGGLNLSYNLLELIRGETDTQGRKIRGPSLKDYVGKASPADLMDGMVLLAFVLETLSLQGVNHRDIKPGNILIPQGNFKRLKLTDFAFAERRYRFERDTFFGTYGFSAPEQFIADLSQNLDHRADMYGLAAVIYYMLTGDKVYKREDLAEFLQHGKPLALPEELKNAAHKKYGWQIPDRLNDFVMKLIQPDRDNRYRTETDVLKEIIDVHDSVHQG